MNGKSLENWEMEFEKAQVALNQGDLDSACHFALEAAAHSQFPNAKVLGLQGEIFGKLDMNDSAKIYLQMAMQPQQAPLKIDEYLDFIENLIRLQVIHRHAGDAHEAEAAERDAKYHAHRVKDKGLESKLKERGIDRLYYL